MAPSNTTAPSCVKGCGFYGSQENKNMCSQFYKDFLKADVIAKSEAKALDVEKPLNPTASNADSGSGFNGCGSSSSSSVTNRCRNSNKKIGLTGFKCRCGHLFCGMHRYPNEHSCTFDFKKADREILVKQNSLVSGDKLPERI